MKYNRTLKTLVCYQCGRVFKAYRNRKMGKCASCRNKKWYKYKRKGVYIKTAERNREIYEKYLNGLSLANLGRLYHLSRQRILQIIQAERRRNYEQFKAIDRKIYETKGEERLIKFSVNGA